jgi:hypothetical protein
MNAAQEEGEEDEEEEEETAPRLTSASPRLNVPAKGHAEGLAEDVGEQEASA